MPFADRDKCIFHVFDGLREGLRLFSGTSRVALIFTSAPGDPPRFYDPQELLKGHEPKLKQIFFPSGNGSALSCRPVPAGTCQVVPDPPLSLSGLVSFGGFSHSIHHQLWFTEHHPDLCATGPTERFLEHAAWMLSQELTQLHLPGLTNSFHVLREYATHAVRDYLVDERAMRIGWDTKIRVYPILDAILDISDTVEEGVSARGELVFVEPARIADIRFLARFPDSDIPYLHNYKHVRKLLTSVEESDRKLVSGTDRIYGIATAPIPRGSIRAVFRGGHGYLFLDEQLVCSFFDGRFHSKNRRAKLVFVEELLLESDLDDRIIPSLLQIVTAIVHHAQECRHGATIIIDLNDPPVSSSGQHFDSPPDLSRPEMLELALALSRVDGAVHIDRNLQLSGFACLLDGDATPGEDRSRGARFNSAVRFTARHTNLIAVVVSADRPVSVIYGGVELTAQCDWTPISGYMEPPPLLFDHLHR